MIKRKKLDIIVIIILPIISSIFALTLKTNTLVGLLLVYGIPSVYLSIRANNHILKSALFSATVGIPLMIIIDYISHYSGIWKMYETSFPFKILDYTVLEIPIWGFLQVYFVVIFYEYFLDLYSKSKDSRKSVMKKMKYLITGIVFVFLSFIAILIRHNEALYIPHFYAILGLVLILIPSILFLIKFPQLIKRFILIQIYFFFFSLLVEFVGLSLKLWEFPGTKFIGWINIFGIGFPFEEFFFWMLLTAIAILSFYEYFDDDTK